MRPTREQLDAFVIRYVVTKVNADGQRTLFGSQQGRNTYATAEEAEQHLAAILKNNNAQDIERYANQAEVRPVECWPVHFDPKTCWFD